MEEDEGTDLGGRAGDRDPIPGPEDREDIAHFFKFNEILHSRYYRPDDHVNNPPTGGDLIVDWSAVAPMRDDPKTGDYADLPEIRALSDKFDATWSDLLDRLNEAFNGEKHKLREAVPLMYRLKDQAQRLMRVPLPDGSGETAGPTWTYRNG